LKVINKLIGRLADSFQSRKKVSCLLTD